MDYEADVGRCNARAVEGSFDTLDYPPFRRFMRGQDLCRPLLAPPIKYHIGERSPDIDRESRLSDFRQVH